MIDREDLLGEWTLRRRIDDARAGAVGVAWGSAVFAASDDDAAALVSTETLTLDYLDRRIEGVQRTLWRLSPSGETTLFFADGRPFCTLDWGAAGRRARPVHLCGDDRYDGAVTVLRGRAGAMGLRMTWSVEGPRKRYVMTTWLRRP